MHRINSTLRLLLVVSVMWTTSLFPATRYRCCVFAMKLSGEIRPVVPTATSNRLKGGKKSFQMTLETTKMLLGRSAEFKELLALKQLDGYVAPDLPVLTSLADIMMLKWVRIGEEEQVDKDPLHLHLPRIETVAAQTRSRRQLRKMILDKAKGSVALLVVSGSSILRKAPLAKLFLPDSPWILKEATKLKRAGKLSADIRLWAVANPNVKTDLSHLKNKIANGAEIIVTQPPLMADRFEDWWHQLEKNNLRSKVRIIIGMPMISSAINFKFWCRLADIVSECVVPSEDSIEFWKQWNTEFFQKFSSMDGVDGFHFMPLTTDGRRMMVDLFSNSTSSLL